MGNLRYPLSILIKYHLSFVSTTCWQKVRQVWIKFLNDNVIINHWLTTLPTFTLLILFNLTKVFHKLSIMSTRIIGWTESLFSNLSLILNYKDQAQCGEHFKLLLFCKLVKRDIIHIPVCMLCVHTSTLY